MAFSDAPSPLSSPAPPSANTADVAMIVKRRHLLCIRREEIGRPTALRSCGGSGLDRYLPSLCLDADAPFQDDKATLAVVDADPSSVAVGCCATAAATHLSEVVFGCYLAGILEEQSPPP
ncbi:unnamed protein product [Lactuca virosa]|uniref:Uncharacterized protein n=1 Tax=Lactuca virosa TaxID=75947 RepID=A0AAU9MS85_9ASTR|nr:unnamed protein product [Lactuca virosa]